MSGIYIHIPFCDTKCIYCDFYSITNHSSKKYFISALIKEIELYSDKFKSHKFDTVYFGGGTPSLLTNSEFEIIFNQLYKFYDIAADSEITIEANPGTLNKEKLKEFRSQPINRLSFGIQSFDDGDLNFLTRIHNSETAKISVLSAQEVGFNNISIDLMFSIPGQTNGIWKKNMEEAIKLGIPHISAYSLIYEDKTYLNDLLIKGKVKRTEIDLERELYDLTISFFNNNGYLQYEISNFSIPGFECRHNKKYWNYSDYIGFGPSASSFYDNSRFINIRNVNKYIECMEHGQNTRDFEEYIDRDTSIKEFIFLGLRSEGIELTEFKNRFGFDFVDGYKTKAEMLLKVKYASIENNKFRLLPEGYAICDEIAMTFF